MFSPALTDQVEFRTATLHVRRVKQGTPSTHPILGDELRALRRLQREQEPKSPFVFTSERGAPFPVLSRTFCWLRFSSPISVMAFTRMFGGTRRFLQYPVLSQRAFRRCQNE